MHGKSVWLTKNKWRIKIIIWSGLLEYEFGYGALQFSLQKKHFQGIPEEQSRPLLKGVLILS